jgi:hypothetical protein
MGINSQSGNTVTMHRLFRLPMTAHVQGENSVVLAQPVELVLIHSGCLGPARDQDQRFASASFQVV